MKKCGMAIACNTVGWILIGIGWLVLIVLWSKGEAYAAFFSGLGTSLSGFVVLILGDIVQSLRSTRPDTDDEPDGDGWR